VITLGEHPQPGRAHAALVHGRVTGSRPTDEEPPPASARNHHRQIADLSLGQRLGGPCVHRPWSEIWPSRFHADDSSRSWRPRLQWPARRRWCRELARPWSCRTSRRRDGLVLVAGDARIGCRRFGCQPPVASSTCAAPDPERAFCGPSRVVCARLVRDLPTVVLAGVTRNVWRCESPAHEGSRTHLLADRPHEVARRRRRCQVRESVRLQGSRALSTWALTAVSRYPRAEVGWLRGVA